MKNLNLERFSDQEKINIETVYIEILTTHKIKEILNKIEVDDLPIFKKCEYLDNELNKFCALALNIMNIKLKIKKTKDYTVGSYDKQKYKNYFESLLSFFEKQLKKMN
jgi:Txe/YoeB family toxin of Txe-Axe toxin-antitoxin module